MRLGALIVAALAAACASEGAGGADAVDAADAADAIADAAPGDAEGDGDGADTEADGGSPTWLATLESLDDYLALKGGQTAEVKYLAWLAGEDHVAPLVDACAFQDMDLYRFHVQFLQSFEPWADLTGPEYIELVLHADTRIWWGGGVTWDATRLHPETGAPGVMLWTLYSDESTGPGLTLDEVIAADAALAPCIPFAAAQRAFWAVTIGQQAFVQAHEAELASADIAVVVGN